MVEHRHGKAGVSGSIPDDGSILNIIKGLDMNEGQANQIIDLLKQLNQHVEVLISKTNSQS